MTMAGLESFKEELKSQWSPLVAVIASDEAEKMCWNSNGLSVTELLRPFGAMQKMNGGMGVPIRTPAEQPIRLYDWTVRFYDVGELTQPSQEIANAHLAEFLHRSATAAAAAGPIPTIQQLIESARVDDASPWYNEYCEEYFRMLKFASHEAVDHPVICLLVVPSSFEDEASSSFADVFEEKAPPFLKQLVRDRSALLHYAFLHDAQTGSPQNKQKAVMALQSLTSAFGAAGHLLMINSEGMPRANPSIWSGFVQKRWSGSNTGGPVADSSVAVASGLSQTDAVSIAAAIEELAVRKIAPHIESRIRQLDQTAMAARRGFKNQLKSFLFRKSTPAAADTAARAAGQPAPGSPRGLTVTADGVQHYSHASIESQLRQLSDLALMVGDCETALTTLRLLASDYKSDKAYLHYAGVQEAMAVATVLYDGPPSEVVATFKEAFYRYDQVAQQGQSRATWYATRAAILMASYLSALGRFSDASWIVMKAHFAEEDLRAALLMERAALLLLRASPPRVRKFAFHLVLAGLRYSKGGAWVLAARSYSLAIEVYKGRRWEIVEEHVREALGKSYREGGDAVAAVHHFAAALTCTQIPAGLQSLHMAQFAEALQAATTQLGYAPVVDLHLPVINTTKVGVSSSGQASYSNAAAREVPRDVWTALEASICPPPESGANWMDGGSSSRLNLAAAAAAAAEALSCCVGEDVGVDVEIKNPLEIELAVTKLRLVCTFEAPPGQQQNATASTRPVTPTATTATTTALLSSVSLSHPFQVREERITLHPGEVAVVHLRVRPLRTGSLNVDGVAWELNGIATGTAAFTIRRRKVAFPNNNTTSSSTSASKSILSGVVAAVDGDEEEQGGEEQEPAAGGLFVKVMPPMPRLQITLEGLPSTLLVGQVAKCSLRLKNAGAMTLHALRCAVNTHSVYLQLGPPSHTQQLQKQKQRQQQFNNTRKQNTAFTSVFTAPPGTKLGVNEELVVDVFIRPTRPGPFSFNLCWYYEPLVNLETLPYRTLRATFGTSALPSLEMRGWCAPVAGGAGSERLLVLRGLNLQGIETFTLREFRLLEAGQWCAAPVAEVEEEEEGEKVSSTATVQLNDMVVGPESAVALHAILSHSTTTSNTVEQQHQVAPPEQQYLVGGELQVSSSLGGKKAAATETSPPTHLMLNWEATGSEAAAVAQGFAVVKIERARDGPGVFARLVGQQSVSHDFSVDPTCFVDVTLELYHELPAALEVRFSTASSDDDDNDKDDEQKEQAPVNQRFVWSGMTAGALPAVDPGTVVRVPLQISVSVPGWVSLEGCWVEWRSSDVPQLSGKLILPAYHILFK